MLPVVLFTVTVHEAELPGIETQLVGDTVATAGNPPTRTSNLSLVNKLVLVTVTVYVAVPVGASVPLSGP